MTNDQGSVAVTREKLVEAAAQVFAEVGFEAATVREICSRAGTNGAAVNYHFGDKLGLYTEVLKRPPSRRSGQPSSIDFLPEFRSSGAKRDLQSNDLPFVIDITARRDRLHRICVGIDQTLSQVDKRFDVENGCLLHSLRTRPEQSQI